MLAVVRVRHPVHLLPEEASPHNLDRQSGREGGGGKIGDEIVLPGSGDRSHLGEGAGIEEGAVAVHANRVFKAPGFRRAEETIRHIQVIATEAIDPMAVTPCGDTIVSGNAGGRHHERQFGSPEADALDDVLENRPSSEGEKDLSGKATGRVAAEKNDPAMMPDASLLSVDTRHRESCYQTEERGATRKVGKARGLGGGGLRPARRRCAPRGVLRTRRGRQWLRKGGFLKPLWHRGFPDERDAEDVGGEREGFGKCVSSRAFVHRAKARCYTWIRGFAGEFSSGKARCHRDLLRSWHRGFPDEREAEGAGNWREGFGRCESSRAFGHRARPDATLGFEGSRGNSHRARLDATAISPLVASGLPR